VVVVCTVAAVSVAATAAVGSPGRSPLLNLILWDAHSLFTLFCIHFWHGGHLQVHLLATDEVILLLIIVCIMLSTLLLMEVLFSEWKVVFMRVH
jgi:hypothetical protein